MTKLLIRLFVKTPEDVTSKKVRSNYITLGSTVGILCNIFLFIIKFIIGTVSGSVSITADAFNNLSDIGSSAVTAIGFKLSEKPADKEHPFGHGRIEYMSGLVVAVLIILVGVELLKSSINKAVNPTELSIDLLTLSVLAISVCVKLWMFIFNRFIGKKINSSALVATAQDSVNDVFATSAVLIAALVCYIFKINIDPYMGIAVALFIIYSGYNTIKETINPLLGMPPEEDNILKIESIINGYDEFLGIHDLIVHNYGPGRSFASLHVEVPAEINIIDCHEKIDACEKQLFEELNMEVVIHMDPIVTKDSVTAETRAKIERAITKIHPNLTLHDFRMVDGNEQINLIFDVVAPIGITLSDKEIKDAVQRTCNRLDIRYKTVITIDRDYVSRH